MFVFVSCDNSRKGNPKVLVFSKTAGYVHASIPDETGAGAFRYPG